MKKKGETKRQRIIIYYVLAIVLPCLILGILALRGIKNDQALVERDQRRNLLEAGQQIILETDTYLSSIENSFARIIDSTTIPLKTIFTDSLLNRFSAQHQVVEGIFFLSGTGDLYLLNNGMLFMPDDFLTVSDAADSQSTQVVLEQGWQIEFRGNDYRKALKYYQNVLPNVTNKQLMGELLNAIARLQKKLKLDDEAIETYNLIWNDYPQVLIQNKIPLGAVALLEKSLLYLTKKDTISALKTVHLLMSQMQKPLWELGYSDYANFLSKIDEIITLCKNSRNEYMGPFLERINTMKDSLTMSEKHTEYLLAFLGNNEVISFDTKTASENNNRRFKTLINGKSYFFSTLPGNDQGHWGLIIDPDFILNNVVHQSILRNANKSNFYWEVTDANEGLLLKSENIPENTSGVNTVFPSNLPSWSMTLYPESSGLFVSLFRPDKSLFLYIFIAIVIILACGLFFTLQTVNNELHLSKMKSYFISTVSHEFKSPLTSIRQMAEMLVRDRVPSAERQRKYYTSILKQSERLSHLIDNILDFSKMEEGHKLFHFEKADIIPVVRDMVESFQQHTADQGFHINLAIPEPLPDVVFDREAMEQVMHNLLDNAYKYSGDSREIEVHLLSKGNKIIISVRDNGVGIRKEDHDKIFSRFYRAGEELTQTVKGSGIGLTIVKQIVEAHHGEITVESSPGEGSTFTVILPMKDTDIPPSQPSPKGEGVNSSFPPWGK
jgi:signal transduction histidine kinase/tetratricopeptide (TPR) repeat protein